MVIPLYQNPELVQLQIDNFKRLLDEIRALNVVILFVNDSPDNTILAAAVVGAVNELRSLGVEVEAKTNAENRGFVYSANVGIEFSRSKNSHCFLLNSDAFPEPGCLTAMLAVLNLDEKFGFVAPRSNNATLASAPWYRENRLTSTSLALEEYEVVRSLLPDFTIVPTVPGFCLLIRFEILDILGGLDLIYSPGYNEENDYIMRANRLGFRCVLANDAYAFHAGSQSFTREKDYLEQRNKKVLDGRFPEYEYALKSYRSSTTRAFEKLLASRVREHHGKSRILLDLSFFGEYYNGTFELAKLAVESLLKSERWLDHFDTTIAISGRSLQFHHMEHLSKHAEIVESIERSGSDWVLGFRFSQPFSWKDALSLSDKCLHTAFYMLDNIASDCYYLGPENPELNQLWSFVARTSSGLAFLSSYSRRNFRLRFGHNEIDGHDAVLMPPLFPEAYWPDVNSIPYGSLKQSKILVIGNHYEHKLVNWATDLLVKQFDDITVHALGYRGEPPRRVIRYQAGDLSPIRLEALHAKTGIVVFPSVYEGFGIPIVKSLITGAHVVARSTDVSREISDGLAEQLKPRLHLFATTDELIDIIRTLLTGSADFTPAVIDVRNSPWENYANAFLDFCLNLANSTDMTRVRDRLELSDQLLAYERNIGSRLDRPTRDVLEKRVNELINSTSWRITAPLRFVSRKLRGIT